MLRKQKKMRKASGLDVTRAVELTNFLSDYTKVLSPKTCTQPINPDQLTVWVFKNWFWRPTQIGRAHV